MEAKDAAFWVLRENSVLEDCRAWTSHCVEFHGSLTDNNDKLHLEPGYQWKSQKFPWNGSSQGTEG
jgi:hypothetical protein